MFAHQNESNRKDGQHTIEPRRVIVEAMEAPCLQGDLEE